MIVIILEPRKRPPYRSKAVSEQQDFSAKAALQEAYESQVKLLYNVFVDSLSSNKMDVEASCQRFKAGLALIREAKRLADGML